MKTFMFEYQTNNLSYYFGTTAFIRGSRITIYNYYIEPELRNLIPVYN